MVELSKQLGCILAIISVALSVMDIAGLILMMTNRSSAKDLVCSHSNISDHCCNTTLWTEAPAFLEGGYFYVGLGLLIAGIVPVTLSSLICTWIAVYDAVCGIVSPPTAAPDSMEVPARV